MLYILFHGSKSKTPHNSNKTSTSKSSSPVHEAAGSNLDWRGRSEHVALTFCHGLGLGVVGSKRIVLHKGMMHNQRVLLRTCSIVLRHELGARQANNEV